MKLSTFLKTIERHERVKIIGLNVELEAIADAHEFLTDWDTYSSKYKVISFYSDMIEKGDGYQLGIIVLVRRTEI